jgi:hypothetical protein
MSNLCDLIKYYNQQVYCHNNECLLALDSVEYSFNRDYLMACTKMPKNTVKKNKIIASHNLVSKNAKVSSVSCHGNTCDIKYSKPGIVDRYKTVKRSKIEGKKI